MRLKRGSKAARRSSTSDQQTDLHRNETLQLGHLIAAPLDKRPSDAALDLLVPGDECTAHFQRC